MKQSPARLALVLLFIFIGCFGAAYAAAGMLTALPPPAVGGTCGPSTGSETALEALAQPGSIGAGPEPPASNATAHHQWETFIQQCQSLADRRGLASLAVFVLSLAVAAIGLIWVLRRPRTDDDADESVDGSSEWPGEPGPGGQGDPGELVGAGAVIAPPAPAYGVAPDPPLEQGWAPQPPAGYPYPAAPPYPTPPPYPPQAAYPPVPAPAAQPYPPSPYPAAQPYPPAPDSYPPPPVYPTAPPAPPAPPVPPAYPAAPAAPTSPATPVDPRHGADDDAPPA